MLETFAGRAYLVCCDAGAGSNLLADTLRGAGRAGKPFEYFIRGEIDKSWLRRRNVVSQAISHCQGAVGDEAAAGLDSGWPVAGSG